MKNFVKMLIIALVIMITILPLHAQEKYPPLQDGIIEGEIIEITEVQSGTLIHIKGKAINETGIDEIKLYISENTKLMNKKQVEIAITDLKVGAKVQATFGPAITRSLPPMGQAKSIILVSNRSKHTLSSIFQWFKTLIH